MIDYIKKNKVDLLLSFGWLVAAFVLFYSLFIYYLINNLFTWKFNLDWITVTCWIVALLMIILMHKLAKHSKDKISLAISLIISLFFVFLAILYMQPESDHSALKSENSPLIFRLSLAIVHLIPMVLWYKYPFQYFRNDNNEN